MAKEQVTEKEKQTVDLMEAATAVRIVNDAIKRERERLKKIACTEEQSPIMIEGETSEGYYCQLMVDPKDAARIMLEYDYPVWSILMEDAPDAMWSALAQKFGIRTVSGVDL